MALQFPGRAECFRQLAPEQRWPGYLAACSVNPLTQDREGRTPFPPTSWRRIRVKAVAIYPVPEKYVPTHDQVTRLLAYLEMMRVIVPGEEGLRRTIGDRPQNLGVSIISGLAELTVYLTEEIADLDEIADLEEWVQMISRRRFYIGMASAHHEINKDNPTKAAMEKILGVEIDYVYCAT